MDTSEHWCSLPLSHLCPLCDCVQVLESSALISILCSVCVPLLLTPLPPPEQEAPPSSFWKDLSEILWKKLEFQVAECLLGLWENRQHSVCTDLTSRQERCSLLGSFSKEDLKGPEGNFAAVFSSISGIPLPPG